jgi:hypothetical protein
MPTYIYGSAHSFSQADSTPQIIMICKEDKRITQPVQSYTNHVMLQVGGS